jgi:DME family drug/metabolite transporter
MKTQVKAQATARLGLASILLAATLWGTVGVVIQSLYQLSDTNPLSGGFLRLALSLPLLFIVCGFTLGRKTFRVARRDLGLMLLIGTMTALYQVCYFSAITYIGVAASTLITLCTAPVWVVLLATVLLRERMTRGVFLAGNCAIAGTILLVGVQPSAMQSMGLGVLLALGSALGYAVVVLCGRSLAGRYHPLQTLTIGFSSGAVILLPFALGTGLAVNYSVLGWLALLYLGIIPTALAYLLYFGGIRHTTATVASIATLLEPLVSTVLAWWLFNEQLGSLGIVGAVLLLGAIGLLYWEDGRRMNSK